MMSHHKPKCMNDWLNNGVIDEYTSGEKGSYWFNSSGLMIARL